MRPEVLARSIGPCKSINRFKVSRFSPHTARKRMLMRESWDAACQKACAASLAWAQACRWAGMGNSGATAQNGNAGQGATELSFDALYEKLPLNEEGLKKSNDSLQEAMFLLGKAYIQEIEDCQAGTETLEKLSAAIEAKKLKKA